MKIGVFEHSWGKGVGGSHMYLGVAAEALSLEHDVTILHQYDQIPNNDMANFLDLDLSRVRFRKIRPIDGNVGILKTRNPIARFRSVAGQHAE